MDITDRAIMISLLSTEQSRYSLRQNVAKIMKNHGDTKKTSLTTIQRHINNLMTEGFLHAVEVKRKDGQIDKRGTQTPTLSKKGLATIIVEGNLTKEELRLAVTKTLKKEFSDLPLPEIGMTEADMDDIITNMFLKIKPKINLNFFDGTYFDEIFNISFIESAMQKITQIVKTANPNKKPRLKGVGRKYIKSDTVNNLRLIHQLLISERNKFGKYAENVKIFIETIEKLGI